MGTRHSLLLAIAASGVIFAGGDVGGQTPPAGEPGVTAFVHANVLPMDREAILRDWTVVVRGERVATMGPSASVPLPTGATVIDAAGKFLIPGLTDMHGHVPAAATSSSQSIEDVLFLYVANGVTTVRGMHNAEGRLALRERAARGDVVSPTLYLAGPPFSAATAGTPEQAAARTRQQAAEGWDLLEIQRDLSLGAYEAMMKATWEIAREVGGPGDSIRVGGEVPEQVGLHRVLDGWQSTLNTIDHMDQLAESVGGRTERVSDDRIARLAANVKASGVWVVPTLYAWETSRGAPSLESRTSLPELRYMPHEIVQQWTTTLGDRLNAPHFEAKAAADYIENRARILAALDDVGARILLGSGGPQPFLVPGFSIHHEMAAMSAAGMSPYHVLRAGTAQVGRHFTLADAFGSVATSQRADLLLLDANPLDDLANLMRRTGVMVRGRWIPQSEIQRRLDSMAQANARPAVR